MRIPALWGIFGRIGDLGSNRTVLHEIVLKNLQQEGLLVDRRQVHLVLAYSGGMDSTVLLHILARLRESQNLRITAAYFEHGWRGLPVGELPVLDANCRALDVPLVIVPTDLRVPHTETAAREARYYALTRLTQDLKAQALITAHQADDQIETMLFRLFRGTGLDGLVGIQKKLVLHEDVAAPVPILRPMLDIKRTDVKGWAKSNNLSYFDDPTNASVKHQRNMIRNEMLPYIEERFPNVKDALFRLSHVADGDVGIINEKIDEIWGRVYHDETLDSILFNQLGRPYQRRIIKRFLMHHRLESDFNRIEDIIDFVEGENRKNLASALMSLEKTREERERDKERGNLMEPAGEARFLFIYKNRISVITRREDQLEPSSAVDEDDLTGDEQDEWEALGAEAEAAGTPVTIPGEFVYAPLNIRLRIVELSEEERNTQGLLRPQQSEEIYADLSDYLDRPLELRTRRPGDKIHPFGMATVMRLKNFFINRGIPRFDRDQVPLLVSEGHVLWAAGVGISEALRVVDKPTHLLKIEHIAPEPANPRTSGQTTGIQAG